MLAARLLDMHVCPQCDIKPHVGGPIVMSATKVLIQFMPAARLTDMAACVGPPDAIVMGSSSVLIEFMPAARLSDMTAHGGTVVMGASTVIIGG